MGFDMFYLAVHLCGLLYCYEVLVDLVDGDLVLRSIVLLLVDIVGLLMMCAARHQLFRGECCQGLGEGVLRGW
jgi:hypothetical protein